MNNYHVIISNVSFIINVIGALIVIYGLLFSILEFAWKELVNSKKKIQLNETIRLKLGSYLVLSLEFFIAGDIVKTVITPSWESLGMLGAIVVIRTVLSYFLTRDMAGK
jgi:uncharacterized membrane protein